MDAISSWMMKPQNKESTKKKMAILLIDLYEKLQGDLWSRLKAWKRKMMLVKCKIETLVR
jgi:hypothetical protein